MKQSINEVCLAAAIIAAIIGLTVWVIYLDHEADQDPPELIQCLLRWETQGYELPPEGQARLDVWRIDNPEKLEAWYQLNK